MSENTNNENKAPELPLEEVVESVEKVEEPAKVVEEVVEEPKVEPVVEEAKPEVITAPVASEKQGLGPVGNGAMGVTTFKEEKKPVAKKPAEKKADTVAIHSTRNVTWSGVGKVYIGYNIVSKEAADKWLTRNHTRIATPEEVAKEFGN